MVSSSHRLDFGLQCGISSVPYGFAHGTALVAGLLGTHELLGDLMRQRYNRPTASTDVDASLSHLGYWTDNGAAYYYRKEANKIYADTLCDVKSDAERRGPPYRYFQLDSFWYLKGSSLNNSNCTSAESGLVEWKACVDDFPEGITEFQHLLGLPIVPHSHSRWFAPGCVYRDLMPFIVDQSGSIPANPYNFFNYFLSNAKENWNLAVCEQDWVGKIYETSTSLQTTLKAEQEYFQEMGQAAEASGVSVAYGTVREPTGVLMALTVPCRRQRFVFASIRFSQDR